MIEAGKTYRTAMGEFECIYVEGGLAWMKSHYSSTAYVWTRLDGKSISLSAPWNVVFDE